MAAAGDIIPTRVELLSGSYTFEDGVFISRSEFTVTAGKTTVFLQGKPFIRAGNKQSKCTVIDDPMDDCAVGPIGDRAVGPTGIKKITVKPEPESNHGMREYRIPNPEVMSVVYLSNDSCLYAYGEIPYLLRLVGTGTGRFVWRATRTPLRAHHLEVDVSGTCRVKLGGVTVNNAMLTATDAVKVDGLVVVNQLKAIVEGKGTVHFNLPEYPTPYPTVSISRSGMGQIDWS